MPAQAAHERTLSELTAAERRRVARWIVISVLAALLTYFGLRGYLTPDLLFHFANSLVC